MYTEPMYVQMIST